MEDCCFECFPDVLLEQIWPPERVIEGMQTCWFLRCKLPALMYEDVGLCDPEVNDWENQLISSLCRFHFKKISLHYSQLYAYPTSYTAFQRLTIRTKAHKRSMVVEDFVHFHRVQCALKREREREIASLNPVLLRTLKTAMPRGLNAALIHLDLSNRAIGVRGASLLARVLEDCEGLLHLDLSNNFIQAEGMSLLASANLACTRLAHLNLHRNHILWHDSVGSNLATFMNKCSQITHLNFRTNDVRWQSDDDDLRHLIGATWSHVLHLDLGSNLNTSKVALISIIAQCSALTALDLDGHCMGNERACSLVEHLPCHDLRVLRLARNGIDASGATVIAQFLPKLSGLRQLDLSHNPLRCRGVSELAGSLAELPLLSDLRLQDTGTAISSATLLVALLLGHDGSADSVPPRRALTSLDLSGNLLSCQDHVALASLLNRRQGVRQLRLGQSRDESEADGDGEGSCRVRRQEVSASHAGVALASALADAHPLAVLETRQCELGPTGAKLLAHALGAWGGWLHTLDLSGNGIGDDGAESLAGGLLSCRPGVAVVRLAANSIQRRAGRIMEGCRRCGEEVDLSGNEVDCAGATALARQLRECGVLRALRLADNQISEQGADALKAAVELAPRSLLLLDLDGNPLSLDRQSAAGAESERERRLVRLRVSLSEYVAPAWEDDELARTRGKRVREWQKKREQAGERPAGDGMGGHWFALGTGMGLR